MTVVGIAMVRDEEDVIGATLRHMATQVDALLVADNRSTDRTAAILEIVAGEAKIPVEVIADREVGYMQSEKMTRLAHRSKEMFDADWIVPFDADEIWYSPWGTVAEFLEALPSGDIVKANLYDHVCTGYDDPNETDPIARIQWRRSYAVPLQKVACRYAPDLIIGMGNHEAWYVSGPAEPAIQRLAIRHFPYRSPEQVVRKVRNGAEAYAATNLPDNYGAHWRQWGAILEHHGEAAIHDLFHKWYYRTEPDQHIVLDNESQGPLVCDPAPVRR